MLINWCMIKSASLTLVLIYGLELDTKMEIRDVFMIAEQGQTEKVLNADSFLGGIVAKINTGIVFGINLMPAAEGVTIGVEKTTAFTSFKEKARENIQDIYNC